VNFFLQVLVSILLRQHRLNPVDCLFVLGEKLSAFDSGGVKVQSIQSSVELSGLELIPFCVLSNISFSSAMRLMYMAEPKNGIVSNQLIDPFLDRFVSWYVKDNSKYLNRLS